MKRNKKALILGSSQGLGFACAKELLENCDIVLVSRNLKHLNSLKSRLSLINSTSNIEVIKCDITDKNDRQKMYNEIKSIDILVSNTGGPLFGSQFDNLEEVYMKTHKDFFISQIEIIENYIENMKKNNWGRVIVISSSILKNPNENLHLSHVYRSALSGYVASKVKNLISNNITINTILAGSFDTERTKEYIKMKSEMTNKTIEEVRNEIESMIPIQRLGKPQELGYLCKFLTDEKASFLTGQHITLDGGVTCASFT